MSDLPAGVELDRLVVMTGKYHPVVLYRGVRYYRSIHGYFCSGNGKILHREIWSSAHGSIPDGWVVHHVDGNKGNNALSNLRAEPWGKHTSDHNKESRRLPIRPKTYCTAQGCVRQAKARGMCTKHYQNHRAKTEGGWPRWKK